MSDSGSSFNSFSTSAPVSGLREFLSSNSLVSRFAFLLLVLFLFVFVLRVGIAIMGRIFKPSESPIIVDGTAPGNQTMTFPQNPEDPNAKTIFRSVNERDGVEFTWSVWVYISDTQGENTKQMLHIFSKGNKEQGTDGIVNPNNAPGLYLNKDTNAFVVVMNTYNTIEQEIEVPDVPRNKWVNVIIRCEDRNLDIFVNGTIARSLVLDGVPKQNYGDIYVALGGGFQGYLASLRYYNYAIGTLEINYIANRGPNKKMVGTTAIADPKFDYLSLSWYLSGGASPEVPA